MSEYNGWTNYATWRINLEIFDGHDVEDAFPRKPEHSELIEYARGFVEEVLALHGSEGITLEYALAFVSDVNYAEITKHWLDDYWLDDDINNDEQARWDDTSAELA